MRKMALLIITSMLLCSKSLMALPSGDAKIVEHDPFRIWKRSKNFEKVKQAGSKVVYLRDENNYFAFWIPGTAKGKRIMIAVHGTGGNPYEELKDELPLAKHFDYIVVAVNWFTRERGYFEARDLYRNILKALEFIRSEYDNDLSQVGYIGFSRGSAIAYEVAHLDAKTENLMDLFICHSGGIPRDFRIEAKSANSHPDDFFYKLANGSLGADALKGEKFFLYSGDKDANWGATMSDQMQYASDLIKNSGGQVMEWVRDPNGTHAGLRTQPYINEKAIRWFIQITTQEAKEAAYLKPL